MKWALTLIAWCCFRVTYPFPLNITNTKKTHQFKIPFVKRDEVNATNSFTNISSHKLTLTAFLKTLFLN